MVEQITQAREEGYIARLGDAASDEIERDFLDRAARVDPSRLPLMDVRPLAELDGPRRAAPPGLMGPAPAAAASGFQRPQIVRPPHWAEEDRAADEAKRKQGAAPERKTFRVVRTKTPIDIEIEDEAIPDKVELVTVYLQRIPSTQIPYLDRLEQLVESVRLKMARIPGRDAKELREIDHLAAEYNALMQQFIRFNVEMPDGTYERLDNTVLGDLQTEVRNMVMNARIQNQPGDGQGK